MGWPLVKSLLWALLLFVQIHEHRACIEEERTGLLELKAFLKSHTNYTKPLLPTWVYETNDECCSWERVNCSTTTGHVINLTLSNLNKEQDYGKGTWFLNVSLLQPFNSWFIWQRNCWLFKKWRYVSFCFYYHTHHSQNTHTNTKELYT